MDFSTGVPYSMASDVPGSMMEYDGSALYSPYPGLYPGQTDAEYQQVNCVSVDGGSRYGVSAVAFDPREELLWTGNQGGHVTSYYSQRLQKYTSFAAHAVGNEARHLCLLDQLVLTLSHNQLRAHIRRGLPRLSYKSRHMVNMQCMLALSGGSSVLLAGHQNTMICYDMAHGKETHVLDVGETGCVLMRAHTRHICCGDTRGRVTLRDPTSLRAVHSLDTHSASVNDLDVHNNLLVTCGFSHRAGEAAVDRHLMVFDLRVLRAISTTAVLIDPFLLKFIPAMSSRLAVISPLGQLQIVETAQLIQPTLSLYTVETGGSQISSLDISSNSQAIAVGDLSGALHLLSHSNNQQQQQGSFNSFSRETEFADVVDPVPFMSYSDVHAPLSAVPAPVSAHTSRLSCWWRGLDNAAYRRSEGVDASILSSMKMVGNIGYAPHPGNRLPNQITFTCAGMAYTPASAHKSSPLSALSCSSTSSLPAGSLLPSSACSSSSGSSALSGGGGGGVRRDVRVNGDASAAIVAHVPPRYRRHDSAVSVSLYSRAEAVPGQAAGEAQSSSRGAAGPSGLENILPNSYCNVMLQVLLYCKPLRDVLKGHLCEREFCLACELRFLFHMISRSAGLPCQASNFLRAFRTIPEATALGLILSDTSVSRHKIDLPRLIQNWNRFILQQLDTELSSNCVRTVAPPGGSVLTSVGGKQLSGSATGDGVAATTVDATADMISQISMCGDVGSLTPTVGINNLDSAGRESKDPLSVNLSSESAIVRLCGARGCQSTRCLKCGHTVDKHSAPLLCNLVYPPLTAASTSASDTDGGVSCEQSVSSCVAVSFGSVLSSSLCRHQSVQAWCDPCARYQPSEQRRSVLSLPSVLAINCGCDSDKEVQFWSVQQRLLSPSNSSAITAAIIDPTIISSQTRLVGGQASRPCRYGATCARPDCRFWHDNSARGGVSGGASSPGVAHKTVVVGGVSWLPSSITCCRYADGSVTSTRSDLASEAADNIDDAENTKNGDVLERRVYDLFAVVCHIFDARHPDKNNLTVAIKSPLGGTTSSDSWTLFNDVTVVPISAHEVLNMSLHWKVPVILYFQSRDVSSVSMTPPSCDVIAAAAAGDDVTRTDTEYLLSLLTSQRPPLDSAANSAGNSAGISDTRAVVFKPLSTSELPQKGELVAMDAEFVTLNQEEAEIRSDGTRSMVKPCHMALARMSCVRGQGELEGVAFIDDYISTQEQVVDYLTQFSGIRPGDLDASVSSKRLTTLKSCYLKLYCLVEAGVLFVGHGLKNDFRVINLYVPSEQVIDTVTLFQLPQQRMLSLRFLAWYFLKLDIQSEAHDSIEDARTALSLYRHYETVRAQGDDALTLCLRQMYECAARHGWQPPPRQ